MSRALRIATALLAISTASLAQTAAKPKPRTAAKPATSTAAQTAPAKPAAQPAAPPQGAPTTETVQAFLQRMFGYNENVAFRVASIKATGAAGVSEVTAVASTPQGQQVLRFFVTGDSQHAIMGEMMPFGTDPFARDRELLRKSAFGPTKGTKDAVIDIVEFADLQCPACKSALAPVQKLQQDFPNARFIFQSFPLESIHPWAMTAAKYLDCISRQSNDAAWNFIEAVYSHQQEINDTNLKQKLDTYVTLSKADLPKVEACVATDETTARIKQSEQIGNEVNVTATPTIFVNGRPLQGIQQQDYEAIKAIVQFEITEASKK